MKKKKSNEDWLRRKKIVSQEPLNDLLKFNFFFLYFFNKKNENKVLKDILIWTKISAIKVFRMLTTAIAVTISVFSFSQY